MRSTATRKRLHKPYQFPQYPEKSINSVVYLALWSGAGLARIKHLKTLFRTAGSITAAPYRTKVLTLFNQCPIAGHQLACVWNRRFI
jgi:hypothetical protein